MRFFIQSPITVENMRTFLLMVAVFATVACAAPKYKRDVFHLINGSTKYESSRQRQDNHTPAPVKKSFKLPSTSYGVPFDDDDPALVPARSNLVDSYGNPVVDQTPAFVVRAQRAPQLQDAPAPMPHQTYGVPTTQAPQLVPHQTYGIPTTQPLQPVPHHTYGVPTTQASQPVPLQTYEIPTSQTSQTVPSEICGAPMVHQDVVYGQQQVDSNGGYIY